MSENTTTNSNSSENQEEFSRKIYNILSNLTKPVSETKTIRIQVNFQSVLFWVPCKSNEKVSWLFTEVASRYQKLKGTSATVERMNTETGASLDPDDILQDVLVSAHKYYAYGQLQSASNDKDNVEKFSVERKLLRDEDSGEIVDTQIVVTLLNQRMIEAVRYFIASDVFYEKRPKVNAEALLQYLEQFKKSATYRVILRPLTDYLEEEYDELRKKINVMLSEGKINYSSLWSIFAPNTNICYKVGASRHPVAARIKTCKYNRSSWFPSFDITCSVIKSNGRCFYNSTESHSISAFAGVKKLKDLPIRPLDDKTKKELEERGKLFTKVGIGAHYMNYHGNIEWKQWWTTNLIKADGRVMVDGVSFSRMNPNYRSFSTSPTSSSIIQEIPDEMLCMTWPTIGGFSFSAKKWGEIMVASLSPVIYDDKAFEKLVFPAEKKTLIKSLVENAGEAFADIISGKGAGCIFLLHGSPGVGKTLTAEAIAELLHRPLYSVSVGELGTNTKELETKLREILELAGIWNAVVLIDEADIFLEKRSENDIMRNAMVGIFLRLLEYHQGVLFLTTNRVRCFDEAFHSRISVALKYEDLNRDAREKIWGNLLEAAKIEGLNPVELAKYELNGRQIRTTIRLAQSLAHSEGVKVSEKHFDSTVKVANQFVDDLMSYDKF